MPFYPKAFDAGFEGDIDVLVDTLKIILCDSDYTYSNAHDFLDDVAAGGILSTATLTGVTSTFSGDIWTLDFNDPTWVAVTTGNTANAVLVYKDTGVAGTSPLIGYAALASNIPTNGGNITGTVNASGFGTVDVTP